MTTTTTTTANEDSKKITKTESTCLIYNIAYFSPQSTAIECAAFFGGKPSSNRFLCNPHLVFYWMDFERG